MNYTVIVALTNTSNDWNVDPRSWQSIHTGVFFTALSHSENYTVSVVAVNSLGQQGPSAVRTFRTRDIRQ